MTILIVGSALYCRFSKTSLNNSATSLTWSFRHLSTAARLKSPSLCELLREFHVALANAVRGAVGGYPRTCVSTMLD